MNCFICKTPFVQVAGDYMRCSNCGHEILIETSKQGYIVNDYLNLEDVDRLTSLDKFKSKMLSRFAKRLPRGRLVDIGSASGKFLYHNRACWKEAIGLEVTPVSLIFSREKLGLKVVENVEEIEGSIDMVTAWHSLEHIPSAELLNILGRIIGQMPKGARMIVSVPNASSRQYAWFGKFYAYYDTPNHLHQFTVCSMRLLMERYGMREIESVVSWDYNTFGWTQGLLNVITRTHNYLYYRLKRRSRKASLMLDIVNGTLLLGCVPLGWLLGLTDMFSHNRQGVMTICFEKKYCSAS